MHRVSFLEWIKAGQFGPLHVGMPTLEVFEILGYPDDTQELAGVVCTGKKRCRYPHLMIGDVQLLFMHPEHQLCMILLDYPPLGDGRFTGEDVFEIDGWELQPAVPFWTMLRHLKAAEISVTQHFSRAGVWDEFARLQVGAGIELLYILEQAPDDSRHGLCMISQQIGAPRYRHEKGARPPRHY